MGLSGWLKILTDPSNPRPLKVQETREGSVVRIFGPALVILGLAQPFSVVATDQVGYMISSSVEHLIVFYSIEIVGILLTFIGAVSFIKLVGKLAILATAAALIGVLIIPLGGLLPEFLESPSLIPILGTVTLTNLVVLVLCRVALKS